MLSIPVLKAARNSKVSFFSFDFNKFYDINISKHEISVEDLDQQNFLKWKDIVKRKYLSRTFLRMR